MENTQRVVVPMQEKKDGAVTYLSQHQAKSSWTGRSYETKPARSPRGVRSMQVATKSAVTASKLIPCAETAGILSCSLCPPCQRILLSYAAKKEVLSVGEKTAADHQTQKLQRELVKAGATILNLQKVYVNALQQIRNQTLQIEAQTKEGQDKPKNGLEHELKQLLAKRELEIKFLEEELRLAQSPEHRQHDDAWGHANSNNKPAIKPDLDPTRTASGSVVAESVSDPSRDFASVCAYHLVGKVEDVHGLRKEVKEVMTMLLDAKATMILKTRELEQSLTDARKSEEISRADTECAQERVVELEATLAELHARGREAAEVSREAGLGRVAAECEVLRRALRRSEEERRAEREVAAKARQVEAAAGRRERAELEAAEAAGAEAQERECEEGRGRERRARWAGRRVVWRVGRMLRRQQLRTALRGWRACGEQSREQRRAEGGARAREESLKAAAAAAKAAAEGRERERSVRAEVDRLSAGKSLERLRGELAQREAAAAEGVRRAEAAGAAVERKQSELADAAQLLREVLAAMPLRSQGSSSLRASPGLSGGETADSRRGRPAEDQQGRAEGWGDAGVAGPLRPERDQRCSGERGREGEGRREGRETDRGHSGNDMEEAFPVAIRVQHQIQEADALHTSVQPSPHPVAQSVADGDWRGGLSDQAEEAPSEPCEGCILFSEYGSMALPARHPLEAVPESASDDEEDAEAEAEGWSLAARGVACSPTGAACCGARGVVAALEEELTGQALALAAMAEVKAEGDAELRRLREEVRALQAHAHGQEDKAVERAWAELEAGLAGLEAGLAGLTERLSLPAARWRGKAGAGPEQHLQTDHGKRGQVQGSTQTERVEGPQREIGTQTETEMSTQVQREIGTQIETEMSTQVQREIGTQIETEMSTQVQREIGTQAEIEMSTHGEREVSIQRETELSMQAERHEGTQTEIGVSMQAEKSECQYAQTQTLAVCLEEKQVSAEAGAQDTVEAECEQIGWVAFEDEEASGGGAGAGRVSWLELEVARLRSELCVREGEAEGARTRLAKACDASIAALAHSRALLREQERRADGLANELASVQARHGGEEREEREQGALSALERTLRALEHAMLPPALHNTPPHSLHREGPGGAGEEQSAREAWVEGRCRRLAASEQRLSARVEQLQRRLRTAHTPVSSTHLQTSTEEQQEDDRGDAATPHRARLNPFDDDD